MRNRCKKCDTDKRVSEKAEELIKEWFQDSTYKKDAYDAELEEYLRELHEYKQLVQQGRNGLIKDNFFEGALKILGGDSLIIFNLNDFIKWCKMVDDMKITPHDTEFRCNNMTDEGMFTFICPRDLVYPMRETKPDMAIKTITRLKNDVKNI